MNKSKTKILKQQKVFPWWLGYLLDNPLRRLLHPAEKLLAPYVKNGMTTLDYGCGFGHYSIGMAKLTGRNGKVIAVDIQKKNAEPDDDTCRQSRSRQNNKSPSL